MKAIRVINLLIVLFVINLSHGLPDGMASCAWGRYKRNAETQEDIADALLNTESLRRNVKFFLYNKDYSYPYQLFVNDVDRLLSGNFDIKKPTKILIHGYRSSMKSSSIVLSKNAYLEAGDFNIVVVDWNRIQSWGINHALPLSYPEVVKKLKSVGLYVASMINFLENQGMDLKTTTVVGHSLGAHVAGIAGYSLSNKLHRIVGLDPAAPYFTNKLPGERLSKEAATHVEVIHTEIQECGLNRQLGHYDFYPNSGINQPGCDTYKCSHSRSYRFFAESLTTDKGFYARRCEDWSSMQEGNCNGEIAVMGGLERTPILEGIYYVKTNAQSPYALGPQ